MKYTRLYNRLQRTRRLIELHAPMVIIYDELKQLEKNIKWLKPRIKQRLKNKLSNT